MRRIFLAFAIISVIVMTTSCARGISPEQAANGKARCGRTYVR